MEPLISFFLLLWFKAWKISLNLVSRFSVVNSSIQIYFHKIWHFEFFSLITMFFSFLTFGSFRTSSLIYFIFIKTHNIKGVKLLLFFKQQISGVLTKKSAECSTMAVQFFCVWSNCLFKKVWKSICLKNDNTFSEFVWKAYLDLRIILQTDKKFTI